MLHDHCLGPRIVRGVYLASEHYDWVLRSNGPPRDPVIAHHWSSCEMSCLLVVFLKCKKKVGCCPGCAMCCAVGCKSGAKRDKNEVQNSRAKFAQWRTVGSRQLLSLTMVVPLRTTSVVLSQRLYYTLCHCPCLMPLTCTVRTVRATQVSNICLVL